MIAIPIFVLSAIIFWMILIHFLSLLPCFQVDEASDHFAVGQTVSISGPLARTLTPGLYDVGEITDIQGSQMTVKTHSGRYYTYHHKFFQLLPQDET